MREPENKRPFWERDLEEQDSLLDRVLSSKAFDILTRAKTAREKSPLQRGERGDKIPLALLNEALGVTPEFTTWLRESRRAMTTGAERQRRREKSKRSRASRRRNQQILATARRARQKRRDIRRAA